MLWRENLLRNLSLSSVGTTRKGWNPLLNRKRTTPGNNQSFSPLFFRSTNISKAKRMWRETATTLLPQSNLKLSKAPKKLKTKVVLEGKILWVWSIPLRSKFKGSGEFMHFGKKSNPIWGIWSRERVATKRVKFMNLNSTIRKLEGSSNFKRKKRRRKFNQEHISTTNLSTKTYYRQNLLRKWNPKKLRLRQVEKTENQKLKNWLQTQNLRTQLPEIAFKKVVRHQKHLDKHLISTNSFQDRSKGRNLLKTAKTCLKIRKKEEHLSIPLKQIGSSRIGDIPLDNYRFLLGNIQKNICKSIRPTK